MKTTQNSTQVKNKNSVATQILAGICHKCSICPYMDRKPNSLWAKLMRWHRTWCPAWAAHTRIYGRKPLS
ncbi:MAG: hypothetical protein ACYS6K_06890 [Planctomycetota bacterium]